MRGRRGLLTCPRCDTTMRLSSARFCNRCRVYLCPACSRKKRCPSKDPTHRVRAPSLPKGLLMGVLFAVLMLPLGALVYAAQQTDLRYAQMPVTDVAALAPGTTAKVFGTMESPANPVIHWTGSSRSGHWIVNRFNVTDATGSIWIDVSRIHEEDSSRIVQPGVHNREWWPGDPVSVVGEVRDYGPGNRSLLAIRLARTPTGFYRDEGALLLFLGTGGIGAAVAVASVGSGIRLRRDHEARGPSYPYKLTDWTVCANCGDRVPRGDAYCPACGASSLREPVRNPPLDRLPTLELRTHFRWLSLAERGVAAAVVVGLPLGLLVMLVWLTSAGLPMQVFLPVAAVLGVALPLPLAWTFLRRTTVHLGPDAVRERSAGRTSEVATREVDRTITVRQPTRTVHIVFNRGGRFVAFGPGLAPADFEAATRWVRELAEVAGIPHREAKSLHEAMSLAYRDA